MIVKDLVSQLLKFNPEAEVYFEGKLKFADPKTREIREAQKCGNMVNVELDEATGFVYVTYS